jgi:hypothetical protein
VIREREACERYKQEKAQEEYNSTGVNSKEETGVDPIATVHKEAPSTLPISTPATSVGGEDLGSGRVGALLAYDSQSGGRRKKVPLHSPIF